MRFCREEKKVVIALLSFFFLLSMVFGLTFLFLTENKVKAENEVNYVFSGDVDSITLADPDTTNADKMAMTWSGGWTGSNVVEKTSDTLILKSTSSQAGVVQNVENIVFTNKIANVKKVSSMKIKLVLEWDGGANNYTMNQGGAYYRLYALNDDMTVTNKSSYFDFANHSTVNDKNIQNNGVVEIELTKDEIKALAGSDGEIEKLQWVAHHPNHVSAFTSKFHIKEISYTLSDTEEPSIDENIKYLFSNDTSTINIAEPDTTNADKMAMTWNGGWTGSNVVEKTSDTLILKSTSSQAGVVQNVENIVFTNKIANVKKVSSMKIKLVLEWDGGANNYTMNQGGAYYRLYALNDDMTVTNKSSYFDFANHSTVNDKNIQNNGVVEIELTKDEIKALAGSDGEIEKLQWVAHHPNHVSAFTSKFHIKEISYTLSDTEEPSIDENIKYLFSNDTSTINIAEPDTTNADKMAMTWNGGWTGSNAAEKSTDTLILKSTSAQAGVNQNVANISFENKIADYREVLYIRIKLVLEWDGGANNYTMNQSGAYYRLYALNDDMTVTNKSSYFDFANHCTVNGKNIQNGGVVEITLSQKEIAALADSDGEIENLQWVAHHPYYVSSFTSKFHIQEISYKLVDKTSLNPVLIYGMQTPTYETPTHYADNGAAFPTQSLGIGVFSEDSNGEYFTLKGYTAYGNGAVNLSVAYPVIGGMVKTLTIKFKIISKTGSDKLIDDIGGRKPYYRLYAVNSDGTVNTKQYFEFNDENSQVNTKDWIELTLSDEDVLPFIDSDGMIQTLQWTFSHFVVGEDPFIYFQFAEISCSLYSEDDKHTVTFLDEKGEQISETTTYNFISEPKNTAPKGYIDVWYLLEDYDGGNKFDFSTRITENIVLKKKVEQRTNYTLFDGHEDMASQVEFSIPTNFINSTVENTVMNLYGPDYSLFVFSAFENDVGGPCFKLRAYTGYHYGAINLTFKNPIENASELKSIKFTVSAHIPTGQGTVIYLDERDGIVYMPAYQLYAVNSDGTLNTDQWVDITDRKINKLDTVCEFTLTPAEIAALINDNNEIETLHWYTYYTLSDSSGLGWFSFYNIEYEYYSEKDLYTVNFYNQNKTAVLASRKVSGNVKPFDVETPEGYEAVWYTFSGEKFDFSKSTDKDVDLYVVFEQKVYSIYFNTFGGTAINKLEHKFGDTLDLPVPTISNDNFTFDGWYLDSEYKEEFTGTVMPARDLHLYAKWKVDTETQNDVNGDFDNESDVIDYIKYACLAVAGISLITVIILWRKKKKHD